jgi:signal transduction histidine kinase/ActR/RegA family two-component response regulator/HAMP domain-containing protein
VKVGTKIFIITLGAITCLVLAFFSVASVLLVDNFDRLENTNMVLNTQKVEGLIHSELLTLDSTTVNYANWDETYNFTLGQNPDFTQAVFPATTFHNLGINAIIIVNGTGDVISRMYYEEGPGILALPLAFFAHLNKTSSELMDQGMSAEGTNGILMVDSTPYLVSAHPIHRSVITGTDDPPAGVFIMAKKVDAAMESTLSEQMKMTISLVSYGSSIGGIGPTDAYAASLSGGQTMVKIMDENHVTGLSLLSDIYGNPALVLRVDSPRELYQKAMASETSLLLSLLIMSVLLFMVTVLVLKFFITSRIDKLNDGVRRIEGRGGGGEKLEVSSNDELGSLAASINKMVTSLEDSKRDLLESERRYKAVVEDQTELVFRATPSGRITFGNVAFLRHFGMDAVASDGNGKNDPVRTVAGLADGFLPVPPSDYNLVRSKIAELTPDAPVFEHEHELTTPQMQTRWLQWTVRGIFSEDGSLSEVQWVGRDVTDRMRLLERLNKIDKIESLGVFAGGIAHDFNNYLTSIMGTLTIMKRGIGRTDPRFRRLEEAERSVKKATELTKQLLTFSKGGEPIKKTVSLPEFVSETAEFGLRGSEITLSCRFPDDLACVEADEGQLFQVISNLIINAKQAMPRGGHIDISASNVLLDESSTIPLPPGKYVALVIADNGVGIPKEVLGKIFDPFFTTKKNGTGLGLTIVHSIVAKHDGFIDVRSEMGAGTAFTIYLPASEARTDEEAQYEDTSEESSGKVLLMDDEDAILEVGAELLTMNGYTVVKAVNGEEAVELYRRSVQEGAPFDAVIMDLTIRGGMGGKDAVKKLLEINPEVKVIVSSGYSNDPVMANFREYGFSGVVQKPYKINEMLDEVRKLVNAAHDEAIPGLAKGSSDVARGAGV